MRKIVVYKRVPEEDCSICGLWKWTTGRGWKCPHRKRHINFRTGMPTKACREAEIREVV